MSAAEGASRAPGRPRRVETTDAILDATIGLLAAVGYEGLTIEAVAGRAEVGRPTIYRRFETKASLVAAAVPRTRLAEVELVDANDQRSRLRRAIKELQHGIAEGLFGASLIEVLAPARREVALDGVVEHSIGRITGPLSNALDGLEEVPGWSAARVEAAVSLIVGRLLLGLTSGSRPLLAAEIEAMIDVILGPEDAPHDR